MDSASDFGSEGCRFESCLGRLFTFVSPILFYNIINSPYKEFVLDNSHNDPSIAQLVERWTVVDSIEIHRSLVQIRFEGIFLKQKITKYFVLYRQFSVSSNRGLVAQRITRLTTDQKIPGSNPGKVGYFLKCMKTFLNWNTKTYPHCPDMTFMPWPGFEPGLLRPQRKVLTTIRSRLNRGHTYISWIAYKMNGKREYMFVEYNFRL